MLDYAPVEVRNLPSFIAVPLAGIRLDADRCGIGPFLLTRLTWSGWRLIEKTAIAEEYLAEFCRTRPLLAILPQPNGFLTEESSAVRPMSAARDQVKLLVNALRLHTRKLVIDPSYFVIYARDNNVYNIREPGVYRSAWLTRDMVPDVQIGRSDVGAIESLFWGLWTYQECWRTVNADIALRNFQWANAPELLSGERIQLLSTCLAALFGDVDERVAGVTYARRVAAACHLAQLPDSDIELFLARTLRRTRNHLAHGVPITESVDDIANRLNGFTAACIRLYLQFSCTHLSNEQDADTEVTMSPFDAFNEAVAQYARGGASYSQPFVAPPTFSDPMCSMWHSRVSEDTAVQDNGELIHASADP